MSHSVIVDYVRTPFARTGAAGSGKPGRLADINAVDLQVPLINHLVETLESAGVSHTQVKKLFTGAVHQEDEQGNNIGRLNVLHKECKLDVGTGGTSIDRFCGSSLEAVATADAFLARNPDHVYICTGVQKMSTIAMGGTNMKMTQGVYDGNGPGFMNMGVTAETLAEMYGITREDQDRFSAESHRKAYEARAKGNFQAEIVPIDGMTEDDGIRYDPAASEQERLKSYTKLPTVFKSASEGGTVTAANASQITDGATAVLVTSEAFAVANNLPIKARILSYGESGIKPEVMGLGPVEASREALEKAGLTMDDIDVVELNEAFAAQVLSVFRQWDDNGMHVDPAKVNVDGGAIALGHPLGASGGRLVGHLAEVLIRENKHYGLATACIGGGQGVAMIIENPHYKPAP